MSVYVSVFSILDLCTVRHVLSWPINLLEQIHTEWVVMLTTHLGKQAWSREKSGRLLQPMGFCQVWVALYSGCDGSSANDGNYATLADI